MSNLYYYSNPSVRPYRLTNTNLVGPNSSLPEGLMADGNPDDKVNYFATKFASVNAHGEIKPNCYVYYRGIKARSEGAAETKEEVADLVANNQLKPSSYWENLTIEDGSSTLMAEANYPTGGNLNTATSTGYNTFYVTHADGKFEGAKSVSIEYDTPGEGEASASWNPFQTGDEQVNGVTITGNRRFRRMTVNGMRGGL